MLRKSALIAVLAIVGRVASVHGQSPVTPDIASDFIKFCGDYGSELVFVGRAEAPVTFRVSGEAEIEKARQNLIHTEADVARLRASLDLYTRLERNAEFEIRLIEAGTEFRKRQNMYPPPHDLTFIPVHVEQIFRGVTRQTLMLRQVDPSKRMEPGQLFLITGHRSTNVIPPFPEMSSELVGLDEYVDTERVTHVALAPQELRFLASSVSGATILGRLRMHSFGHGASAPLSGVRIVVSSGTQVVEATTSEDGSFTVTGIQSGRLAIKPVLQEDLTVVNKSALTIDVREGGCTGVYLTAALNGRLRGRIISATGTSLDGVKLVLHGVDPSGPIGGGLGGSHLPSSSALPNQDGTFEFSGVSPGSYVLSAWLEKMTDSKRRDLRTYFPGTPDMAAAQPIVIGRATQHDGFDFLVTTE